jgi:predicted RNA binding protein YcfA (HicA-like mRNA interferase family)
LTVPLHDPLKKGTLNRILKDAGISVEELRSLMKR